MWLAIEKDHRRFYPQYTAASQTGPYMAHIEGDRRGYSRSLLKGSQDFSKHLATGADGAQCLISYLSPQQPAIVFGTSSGAIVPQALLVRHSSCVANAGCSRATLLRHPTSGVPCSRTGSYPAYIRHLPSPRTDCCNGSIHCRTFGGPRRSNDAALHGPGVGR